MPAGTKNGQVIALAKKESRVLITRDSDFSNQFLYPPSQYKGIVVLKIHPPRLENLLSPLEKLFQELSESAFSGKLVILEEKGLQLLS